MTNYFEFFNIPVAYAIDEALLKKSYYANSKSFHPDLHAQSSYSDQEDMLKQSTLNNLAYKTLSKPNKRIAHILELYGKIGGEQKAAMPQSFLMEMMDINEQVMELQMDFNEASHSALLKEISDVIKNIEQEVFDILSSTAALTKDDPSLDTVKDYYLKKKYILRLQDNINGIDPEM